MAATIITIQDLKEFKEELLTEIESILRKHNSKSSKKWLRSKEVVEILKISLTTLNTLKANGTLPFTKVGGSIYYDEADVQQLFTDGFIK